ncbi:MAG: hypothetical protein AAF840_10520, partial [Bacteroidota bacterium]
MSAYQKLEKAIYSNNYLEEAHQLMADFREANDKKTEAAIDNFIAAQHIFLLISEHKEVQSNLQEYKHELVRNNLAVDF